MNLSEELYILYRRLKAVFGWSVYWLCSLSPIKKNKIVFSAFEGGGYGCSPKYIAEELIRRMNEYGEIYDLVWLVNDTNKKFPKEIRAIKNTLWNRAYHLSTAKVWVDNARKNYGTRKRKGQFYMQTWHGQIGIKPIGRMRGKSFSRIAQLVTHYDSNLEDCFLVNSKYALEKYSNSFYNETFLMIGAPRSDILINGVQKQHENIRRELNLPADVKLVMYAPTFRGGSQSKVRSVYQEENTLDYKSLKSALEKRFGGNWHILLRLHPQLALRNNKIDISEEVKSICTDISFKDDLYEYLAGVDAFISDYSSAMMDAALMKIPVFTYADDVEKYIKDRGKLYRDILSFPFPVASTNKQLINDIDNFNEEEYLNKLENFFITEEVMEDGNSSKRAVDIIIKNLK